MNVFRLACGTVVALVLATVIGCGGGCQPPKAQSVSGVRMAEVGKVQTDDKGRTIEQRNIIDRITLDNDLGTVRHLYVISAYSGQVILYSPVRGKVTSGGKSLSPKTITTVNVTDLPAVDVGGHRFHTNQLPNEDGTYGSGATDYIYWFTPEGKSHQHFMSGGQIIHISDTPITVKGVVISIEK